MKKYLYAYFGFYGLHKEDIPGHFLYQPFILEEICSYLSPNNDYTVDTYSFINDDNKYTSMNVNKHDKYLLQDNIRLHISEVLSCYHKEVNDIISEWGIKHLNCDIKEDKYDNDIHLYSLYYSLHNVIDKIINNEYDTLILKARFRNTSTHGKKLYDVTKFEALCYYATNKNLPIIIIDTDLALNDDFIVNFINKNDNVKIMSLGNLEKAYPLLNVNKIIPYKLFGVSVNMLQKINEAFKNNIKKPNKTLLYYGNIAFSNYKKGHTKNIELLEYLIKLSEDDYYKNIKAYIIGKVEDSRYLAQCNHVKRSDREYISSLHKNARISVNISKLLYDETDFTPARVSESWIFGIIPLSFSSNTNYQNNPLITFSNYREFKENVKFIMDMAADDYCNFFMQCLKRNIDYRLEKI